MPISRRNFLRDGAQALSAASLLGAAVAGAPAAFAKTGKAEKGRASAKDISVKDVAGLALIAGSGCNVVALPGPDGALMIDGGLAVNSALLLAAVARATNTKRVATLINTHWHPEQTGSNEAVGKAGGTIIAHEVTKLALGARNRSALYEGLYGPLPKDALPTQTTYNTGRCRSPANRWTIATCLARTQWRPVHSFPEAQRDRGRRAGGFRQLAGARLPQRRLHARLRAFLRNPVRRGQTRHHHHPGQRPDADWRGHREAEGHLLVPVQAVLHPVQQGRRPAGHRRLQPRQRVRNRGNRNAGGGR